MKAIFDNGKYNCKAIIGEQKILIPSKVEEGASAFNEDTIIFNNKEYTIGEEATKYDYNFTKNSLHHKLILYYILSKYGYEESDFDLIIGCPLSSYLNKKEQIKYASNFGNNNKPVELFYNNMEKIININSVTVVPETIGGYINDLEISKKQIRGVIDIGGLNINCAIYNMGNPVKNKMFTLNLGTHILIKNIQQAVLTSTEKIINEYMCEYLLKTKDFKDENLQIIFEGECIKFVRNIKNYLIKNDWELDELELKFIGGGSILLNEYIQIEFYNPSIENDIFANCKAFKKFGEAKIGKK